MLQRWGERLFDSLSKPWPWLVLFLVGLAARLVQYLGNPSYWYDETVLTTSIFDRSYLDLLGPLPGNTIIPPAFLWLLRACYEAIGPQEWVLRLPAFLAGIAALFLMIPLARCWLPRPGWLWVVGLAALSTNFIDRTVEVRAYTADFLCTVVVLGAGWTYLNAPESRQRVGASAALLSAAIFFPWLSFASALVLASVSGVLFVDYLHHKGAGRLGFWCGFNALLALTGGLVWYFQARHLYYPGLKEHWTMGWGGGFPTDYSPGTLLAWTFNALVNAAEYATQNLRFAAVLMLVLAAAGAVKRWQRSKAEALLLTGPILVTYLAAVVGKYPFADRTVFFLAPCIWLLVGEGLLDLAQRLPKAAKIVVPLLIIGLLAPGLCKTVKYSSRVVPGMEYREALQFVHEHRSEDDAVWNWCPSTNTTYERVFSWPVSKWETGNGADADMSRPLWIIVPNTAVDDFLAALQPLSVRQTLCRQFIGVKVLRFERLQQSAAEPEAPARVFLAGASG